MRDDCHRPTEMNPEHYEYLGWIYQGISEAILKTLSWAHKDPTYIEHFRLRYDESLFNGNWRSKGTCDHCGAYFGWGNVYLHTPTNEKVVVGWICAEKFNLTSFMQLKQKEADRHAELYRRRLKLRLAEEQYRDENWLIANIIDAADPAKNSFLTDLRSKLHEYGSLTERQGASAIASAIKDYWYQKEKEEREANQINAEDVPEGKGLTITGMVISIRYEEDNRFYGVTNVRMLVQDDRGFRVWGTMPTSLENSEACKGSRIQFIANVTPSKNDSKFGFFKRPRKAELIS